MSDAKLKEEMEQAQVQENNNAVEKEEIEDKEMTKNEEESVEGSAAEKNAEGATAEDAIEEQKPSLEELQAKIAELEQQVEDNYQKYLRAQADFDNFRRRTRKEKEEQAKYASLPLVEQMLPIIDNFERALAASEDAQDVETLAKGVEMVFRQVEQALQAEGVEVIPTEGTVFDPHVHQAVMMVESEEYDSGIVVEEVQKGYKLKDKVIRPAMVKVNS